VHPLTDTALPGIAAALDCEAMRCALAGALGCRANAIAECAIERVKYRPGRSALVLYRVAIEEPGPSREALVYATVYPAGTTLRVFPEDRKLPALRLLGDAERLRGTLLPEVVRSRWATGFEPQVLEPQRCSVSRVSYFPEHAYTARVDVGLGEGRDWALYAKTQFTARGARTFAALRRLWQTRARREAHLRHTRPVLYQNAASTLWQEALSGSTLEALATQGRLDPGLALRVGEAVAALHGVGDIDDLESRDTRTCLARLQEASGVLAGVLPRIAAQVRKVVDRLESSAPRDEAAPATLHGDLHLNNILVDSGGVGLVDLDDLCRGPAELELGSFAAALMYRALLHGGHAEAGEALEPFLEGYRGSAQRPISAAHVRWHAAAALIHERAWRCLTSLKPGRLELVQELVTLAENLAGGRRSSSALAA
jgi:aminoglycoside phosphotransferase (APT) family kinase protein